MISRSAVRLRLARGSNFFFPRRRRGEIIVSKYVGLELLACSVVYRFDGGAPGWERESVCVCV